MSLTKYWRYDAQSSLVTFLVALPLCLGIALASNAPLVAGLYAGIIGGIVVGIFSGSHVSVSGPAAGLTVIVVSAIETLGSFETFTAAVLLSGILQIILGLTKAGKLGDYFPSSVIKGMLAAIGIILILKQVPHAVGYDVDFMGDESFEEGSGENTFSQLLNSMRMFSGGAFLISALSFFIILGWEKFVVKKFKFMQFIPGALLAVLTGVVLNETFSLVQKDHLVSLPFTGGLSDFLSGIRPPSWIDLGNPKVILSAVTIAIVGSLESLLSVDAGDKLDPQGRTSDKNRELLAQGLGNSLSGLVGALPLTAVIVRTTANISSGARTRLSAILHGVWLALCAILIPGLLNKIPLAALATILILVGYKLTKPDLIKSMYAKGASQFVPFVVTILAILFTDLLMGIGIGFVVGFIFVIRSNVHKSIVMVNEDNRYLIKFYKDVSFVQRPRLVSMLNSIPDGSSVLIDGSASVFVDADIEEVINEYVNKNKGKNTMIELRKSSLALCSMFKG